MVTRAFALLHPVGGMQSAEGRSAANATIEHAQPVWQAHGQRYMRVQPTRRVVWRAAGRRGHRARGWANITGMAYGEHARLL